MRTLRIGTRRSRLAIVQAELTQELLRRQGVESELVPMSTTGDKGGTSDASPQGLKGLWIDTILEALRDGRIDLAVHSAKDMPAEDDEGLVIGAVPEREAPHDVLLLREEGELTAGMVVGTSSLRRKAQITAAYPGIGVAELRGNVETRLRKLADGEVDAAILAAAGLSRLGIAPPHANALGIDVMIPAPGQGCLAIQSRADDREVLAVLMLLEHRPSRMALDAERALMRRIGGGCALPLGAIGALKGDLLRLAAVVASPDGARLVTAAAESDDPTRAADLVADELLAQGADKILAEVRSG